MEGHSDLKLEAYPAATRSSTEEIDGIQTSATCIEFADKLLITISQDGRLAHWVHVLLNSSLPDPSTAPLQVNSDAGESLLPPISHLTATTILGGADATRDTVAQLLARQIAAMVQLKRNEEQRLVVVGLGLRKGEMDRGEWLGLLGVASAVL
ncbi:hypothetical protein P152DRAFT_399798 [Eremomyces bilateralis CBS 781.70]|uniref:Proteasome assembly chaperone 3 n=1 Tax=Eremomyces bilateralis CBS 781.70 TaxID=1392243 RepID=A0A6G1FZI1_9PEZI|nr:uncharacterized protein P152DRAFT_399798 [Eremomyces bilateralis CBS 781.70]KAF1810969.1 hypothetical protein P152DRAFT_399798 [Eremomyces bilateralis CBS 781.70]